MRINSYIQRIAFIILIFTLQQANAQWSPCDGIHGGYCSSVAFNGTEIYTGTWYTGIHKSADNGASWTQTGLNGGAGNAITASNGNIIAGVGTKIYKSGDGGATWTETLSTGKNVSCLISTGNMVFAGISNYNGGVYYSVNGGNNWIQTSLQQNINAIAIHEEVIFAGDNEFGVFRSTDNGITWTQTPLNNRAITALAVSGNYILAGTKYNELYISGDDGVSWANIDVPGSETYIYSLSADGDYTYAGFRDAYNNPAGVWVSIDHGLSWTQTPLNDRHVVSLASSGANVLAGTLYYGAYFSADYGQSWMQTLLNCREVFALESIDNHLFAGSGCTYWTNSPQAIGGVYSSTDNGTSWALTDLADRNIFSMEAVGNTLYAGTSWLPHFSTAGMMVSPDYGTTWNQSMLNNAPVLSLSSSGQNMYAGMYGTGVYYSPDGGNAWWQTKMTGNEVISVFADEDYVLAGCSYDHGIFRSDDLGETWNHVQNAMSPSCFAKMDTILFCGSNLGIHRSYDKGLTWTRIEMPNTQVNALEVHHDILFIATQTGVFYSTDKGEHWIEMNQGFNGIPVVNSLLTHNGKLYAGTRHYSLWSRWISDILTVQEPILQSPVWLENYPNPFSTNTSIRFSTETAGMAILSVYDLRGVRLASLLDSKVLPGEYSFDFDATAFPAGLFIVHLQLGDKTFARKLIKTAR